MKSISFGLLGAGNVGRWVVRILEENRESIERRLGASVRVKRVLVGLHRPPAALHIHFRHDLWL